MAFQKDALYARLQPHFHERIRRDEPLSEHCAFGIGGPADLWLDLVSKEELFRLVQLCGEHRVPLLLIGNGTNILFADQGVRGIVAHLHEKEFEVENEGDSALLLADAGLSWPSLVNQLASMGWSGLQFTAGIPGTLGGGVMSNAGAHNKHLGQVLEWIEVLDARGVNAGEPGAIAVPQIRRYSRDELDLRYHHSRLREQRYVRWSEDGSLLPAPHALIEPPEMVLRLALRLYPDQPEHIREEIGAYEAIRRAELPREKRSGPVFLDPEGQRAGELIKRAGLRGRVFGNLQVSPRNANYLINRGGASANDVVALISYIRGEVLARCGVDLAVDLELQGEWQPVKTHTMISAYARREAYARKERRR
ncbi:UDP-N-acetylmuramate dehydrogenase [Thermosporothrix hazakensis]|jgi:UDP-N-acetylmuramate dehydrogenase|uniref:UDP-N-acetylenolpyruvoylglucosamine reductase n=1 Tax=Thermosporothrix hazakensis TaxID=644383 RepID=A0A326UCM9_THEHA|nr:FAD-binding protein [Thermosporothrix hazakensis]PZW34359.1 UDP-N-acetylmuramate dehydrogenase [Thermosporothrix hazakensis]GCE46092.1 UDP-N-acetylenolpyruvoylglucosamine reductase [Thermosporothrix hazakensis]